MRKVSAPHVQINVALILAFALVAIIPIFGMVYAAEPQIPGPGIPPPVSESTKTFLPTPTATATRQSTSTPRPTLTPCPLQMQVEDVTIIFDQVASGECARIFQLVSDTQAWLIEQELDTGPAEVYVFGNFEDVVAFEYGIHKGSQTYEEVEKSWLGGSGARSHPGVVILFTGGQWWKTVSQAEADKAVVHEMVHIVQYWLYGEGKRYFRNVPFWFSEGQAEYISRMLLQFWGVAPLNVTQTLRNECNGSYGLDVRGNCLYVQGEQMFILLSLQYGDRSFQVWELLGEGVSFEASFKEVYGITVSEFGRSFDAFHRNKYRFVTPIP